MVHQAEDPAVPDSPAALDHLSALHRSTPASLRVWPQLGPRAPPGSLLEMPVLRPYPGQRESELWGWSQWYFNKPSQRVRRVPLLSNTSY